MTKALDTLRAAGLSISLTDDLRLKVTPSSHITPEMREFAKAHREELIALLLAEQAPPPPPPTETALTRDEWDALDRAYQAHHWTCPTCIAAGKGYGLRCGTGAALWADYDRASEPPRATRKDERQ